MDNYNVYAKTTTDGTITEINSSAFLTDATGYTLIDSGTGDKFMHAQGNYLPLGFTDNNGIYNYKLVDGIVTERTADDKAPALQLIANNAEINQLKQQLADTDYIAAKIAEGAASAGDYAEEIAQRQAWRDRINQLEVKN